ncbi:hemerythrin domain-containing protein [Dactylosporangium sp. AC04546]|uniref:hemerythrin domain-containing protein n=1 Tax=Dactylosporangium sp. AC04546 TaxID=2862460 RepID=UPI001EDD7366|nr:hemerythrin domain-containing protein [Dactylosporangium sp. AC04546]WVK82385.1 hemerythrin domain-containing protein [Dactylosporangium sp. AC04546]
MSSDLVAGLVADHRRLEELFAEIETSPDPAARRGPLDAALKLLARHTAGEEEQLHPLLGAELAAYEAAEHARVAELVAGLDGNAEPLAVLLDTVRQHMQEEETELFPRLLPGENRRV